MKAAIHPRELLLPLVWYFTSFACLLALLTALVGLPIMSQDAGRSF